MCRPINATAVADPIIDALSIALANRRECTPRRQIIHTAKQINNANQESAVPTVKYSRHHPIAK
jgi:hypothetical protein